MLRNSWKSVASKAGPESPGRSIDHVRLASNRLGLTRQPSSRTARHYGKRTVHGFVDSSPAGEPGGFAVDNDKTVTHRAAL